MKKESFERPWFLREAPVGAPNRGHALEFHLAVGIHERLKKVNYLTRDELVNAILKYGKKTTIGDEFSDKEDTFVLQGNITGPVVKHNTIKNLQPGAIFDPNIRGVLKFVNKELDKQIRFIHNNNRKDKVVASTVGIGGDKVDLQVLVIYKDQSGKEIKEPIDDLSMSLKFKSREFGQTKISTKGGQSGSIKNLKTVIDKQFVKLFSHLGFPNTYNRIGKPIVDSLLADKNYTKNWLTWRENYKVNPGRYDLRKKEGPPGSEKVLVINEIAKQYMTDLYQKMSDAMNITFKGKNGELKEKQVIGNFLINELTGGENLSVLKFDDNAYTKMSASKLKELQKLLRKIEIRVEFQKC